MSDIATERILSALHGLEHQLRREQTSRMISAMVTDIISLVEKQRDDKREAAVKLPALENKATVVATEIQFTDGRGDTQFWLTCEQKGENYRLVLRDIRGPFETWE